jgi:hypothetical protein
MNETQDGLIDVQLTGMKLRQNASELLRDIILKMETMRSPRNVGNHLQDHTGSKLRAP